MPLYTAQKHSKIIKQVLVNDTDITNLCFEADTDRGCVKFFVRNKNGNIVVCRDESNGNDAGDPLVAIVYGKVEVILHDLPQQLMDAGGVLEDQVGIKPSQLLLSYNEWMEYIKNNRKMWDQETKEWYCDWSIWDMALSPISDEQRRWLRYGHYQGWVMRVRQIDLKGTIG